MKNTSDEKWAAEVRAIRAWLNWTRKRFAKALSLSENTIANYERGNTKPTVDVWEKMVALRDDHKKAS